MICFSKDSSMLAIASRNWGVQLLDSGTGNQLFTNDESGDELPLAFSPDGGQLLTCCLDRTYRLRDLRLIRQELAEIGLDWHMPPIPPRTTPRIDLTLAPPAH